MAKKIYIGNGNIAHNVNSIYVGINGLARKVKKGYIGIGGIARLFYQKEKQVSVSNLNIYTNHRYNGHQGSNGLHAIFSSRNKGTNITTASTMTVYNSQLVQSVINYLPDGSYPFYENSVIGINNSYIWAFARLGNTMIYHGIQNSNTVTLSLNQALVISYTNIKAIGETIETGSSTSIPIINYREFDDSYSRILGCEYYYYNGETGYYGVRRYYNTQHVESLLNRDTYMYVSSYGKPFSNFYLSYQTNMSPRDCLVKLDSNMVITHNVAKLSSLSKIYDPFYITVARVQNNIIFKPIVISGYGLNYGTLSDSINSNLICSAYTFPVYIDYHIFNIAEYSDNIGGCCSDSNLEYSVVFVSGKVYIIKPDLTTQEFGGFLDPNDYRKYSMMSYTGDYVVLNGGAYFGNGGSSTENFGQVYAVKFT